MGLSARDLEDIRALLKRDPTPVEYHVFEAMWSEHCSYKSSRPTLKQYLPVTGSNVRLGIGEDAGIVDLAVHNGVQYCVAVSHESHNHPSQILPVEGAATGVGGVVRDVYCMGADVFGVLDSLHFGIPEKGVDVPVEDIAEEVVQGVSDYGNALGVPVLGGETLYHPSYTENCLVNVAAVGILTADDIIRSRVPKRALDEPYDIILVGKSTDQTGFGGASFSSVTLDQDNEAQNIGAVQVHDPFLKRVLVEAIKKLQVLVRDKGAEIGFKDLGAGGIACVTSELAAAGGFGVTIDLSAVNTAMDRLAPEIIACSETQERFCLAVPKWLSPDILKLFNEEFELPKLYHKAGAVVIGQVEKEPVYRVMSEGRIVCELPVSVITTDVRASRESDPCVFETDASAFAFPRVSSAEVMGICGRVLADRNVCSKRYVYRFYDNAVRGDTVVYPGEADAVVVTPIEGSPVGVAVSMDSNLYGFHNPYVSGAAAVCEAVRNITAVGAVPLALTDCLNYGNPEKPSVFFDFQEGVRGIGEAAKALGEIEGEALPIISGNVSFYNESKNGSAIIPSPVLLAVGKLADARLACTMQIKHMDSYLFLIGNPRPEFGGTLVQQYISSLNPVAPMPRFAEEKQQNTWVRSWISGRLVSACHDISVGGLWVTLCEMVLGERGLAKAGVDLRVPADMDLLTTLFSENGGYVVEVPAGRLAPFEASVKQLGADRVMLIGTTRAELKVRVFQGDELLHTFELNQLETDWNSRNLF